MLSVCMDLQQQTDLILHPNTLAQRHTDSPTCQQRDSHTIAAEWSEDATAGNVTMKKTEQSRRSAVASVVVLASRSTRMELTNTCKDIWRNTGEDAQ